MTDRMYALHQRCYLERSVIISLYYKGAGQRVTAPCAGMRFLQIVQAGAAAAAAAPLLRPSEAQAVPLGSRYSFPYDKSPKTPVITIFDHRGCDAHENKE
jgi:hypothetical protein